MNGKRIAQERTFAAADEADIFYPHWPGQNPKSPKRAIVIL